MLGCHFFSGLFLTGEIRVRCLPRCDRGRLRAKGSDDQERGLQRIALRSWPLRSNLVLHEASVPGSIYIYNSRWNSPDVAQLRSVSAGTVVCHFLNLVTVYIFSVDFFFLILLLFFGLYFYEYTLNEFTCLYVLLKCVFVFVVVAVLVDDDLLKSSVLFLFVSLRG